MGQELAQNEVEDLGDIEMGNIEDVEIEDLGDIDIGKPEDIDVEEPLPQVIAQENDGYIDQVEDLGDIEMGNIEDVEVLPQVIAEEDPLDYDFKQSKLDDTWWDFTKDQFGKFLTSFSIPYRVTKVALSGLQNGMPPDMIAEEAMSVATDLEREDLPQMQEIIFNGALQSGIDPEFARQSADFFGPTGEFVGEAAMDLTNIPLGPLKLVSVPIRSLAKSAIRKPFTLPANFAKKILFSAGQLSDEAFSKYLHRYKEIGETVQRFKPKMGEKGGTSFDKLADEVVESYDSLIVENFENAERVRELIVGDKSVGIPAQAIRDILDASAAKMKSTWGSEAKGAISRYDENIIDLENSAARSLTGGGILDEIQGKIPDVPFFGEMIIPAREVKEILRNIDASVKVTGQLLTRNSSSTSYLLDTRKGIDNLLKAANPEYKEQMKLISRNMEMLTFVRDKIGASVRRPVDEKISGKMMKTLGGITKEMSEKNKRDLSAIRMIETIANRKGELDKVDFIEMAGDLSLSEMLENTTYQGFRKGGTGGFIGAGVGAMVSKATGIDPITTTISLAALGATAGAMSDTYGRVWTKKLIDTFWEDSTKYQRYVVKPVKWADKKISNSLAGSVASAFAPGITSAMMRRFVDQDKSYFSDYGEIKIDDFELISAAQGRIKSDNNLKTIEKYKLITDLTNEFIDNGFVSLTLKENKKPKADKMKELHKNIVTPNLFKKRKTALPPSSGFTFDTEARGIRRTQSPPSSTTGPDEEARGIEIK